MGGGVDFNQTDHLSQFIYIHRIVLYVLYLVVRYLAEKDFVTMKCGFELAYLVMCLFLYIYE